MAKPRCLTLLSLSGLFDCGKEVYVRVAFQRFYMKFSHIPTSPMDPQVPFPSRAPPAVTSGAGTCSCVHVKELQHQPGLSFDCFFVCLFSCFSSLLQLSLPPSPLSPSRPKLSSFLPSHGFLLQLLSLQKT